MGHILGQCDCFLVDLYTLHFRFLQELSAECSRDGARSTGLFSPLGAPLHSHMCIVHCFFFNASCLLHTRLCIVPLALASLPFCSNVNSVQGCAMCTGSSCLPWGPFALASCYTLASCTLAALCIMCIFPREAPLVTRTLLHSTVCYFVFALYLYSYLSTSALQSPGGRLLLQGALLQPSHRILHLIFPPLCISLLLQVSDQSGAGVSLLKIIIFRRQVEGWIFCPVHRLAANT